MEFAYEQTLSCQIQIQGDAGVGDRTHQGRFHLMRRFADNKWYYGIRFCSDGKSMAVRKYAMAAADKVLPANIKSILAIHLGQQSVIFKLTCPPVKGMHPGTLADFGAALRAIISCSVGARAPLVPVRIREEGDISDNSPPQKQRRSSHSPVDQRQLTLASREQQREDDRETGRRFPDGGIVLKTNCFYGHHNGPRSPVHSPLPTGTDRYATPSNLNKSREQHAVTNKSSLNGENHCWQKLQPGTSKVVPLQSQAQGKQFWARFAEKKAKEATVNAFTETAANMDEDRVHYIDSDDEGASHSYEAAELTPIDTNEASYESLGLPNVGNSCFKNAVLQVLFYCEPFAEDLLHSSPTLSPFLSSNSLYRYLRYLIQLVRSEMQDSYPTKVRLVNGLSNAMARTGRQFVGNTQHDAHEFLCEVFNQLTDEVNRANRLLMENSSGSMLPIVDPVASNFDFELTRVLSCTGCGSTTKITEPVRWFSVIVPRVKSADSSGQIKYEVCTVQDALEYYLQPEVVERSCRCGSTATEVHQRLSRKPSVLVIHIKRYRYKQSVNDRQENVTTAEKNNSPLLIPRYLSLDHLMNQDVTCRTAQMPHFDTSLPSSQRCTGLFSQTGVMQAAAAAASNLSSVVETAATNSSHTSTDEEVLANDPVSLGIRDKEHDCQEKQESLLLSNAGMPSTNEPSAQLVTSLEPQTPVAGVMNSDDEPMSSPSNVATDRSCTTVSGKEMASDAMSTEAPLFLELSSSSNDKAENSAAGDAKKIVSSQPPAGRSLPGDADSGEDPTDAKSSPPVALSDGDSVGIKKPSPGASLDMDSAPTKSQIPSAELDEDPVYTRSTSVPVYVNDLKEYYNAAVCYELTGVISHLGDSPSEGHYVNDVLDIIKDRWLSCDDRHVTEVSLEEVQIHRQTTGYMLIYMDASETADLRECCARERTYDGRQESNCL